MKMSTETEVRDAVIKLEAKMEVMSDSMVSMASSVAKLADLRLELVLIKKDINVLETNSAKAEKAIGSLCDKYRELEKVQDKNTYVIGKIEIFWTALITGAGAFIWWLART